MQVTYVNSLFFNVFNKVFAPQIWSMDVLCPELQLFCVSVTTYLILYISSVYCKLHRQLFFIRAV